MKLTTNPPALKINNDRKSLRVKTEIGYRDFSFDGVSLSEEDDLDGFYKKFVESRINGVKLGNKCTIMMYGPTGSGKSHTMFGCPKQPGIVYKSLKDILSEEEDETGEKLGVGKFVQVTVLEVYNEEIYDLLSSGNTGGGFSLGWPKGSSASKVKSFYLFILFHLWDVYKISFCWYGITFWYNFHYYFSSPSKYIKNPTIKQIVMKF